MTERRWMLSLVEIDRILIAGAGTADVNILYVRNGNLNDRPYYEGSDPADYIKWNPSTVKWEIYNAGVLQYESAEDVMNALLVVTWALVGGSNPLPVLAVDTSNTFNTEVFPANTADVRFTWERNLDAGQIFFRKKLDTELSFGGKSRQADFDRFWNARVGGGCDPFYIRQETRCNGRWQVSWTGVFGVATGTFNLDSCLFRVKPEPVDEYSCFLANAKREVNIMAVDPEEVEAVIGLDGVILVTRSYDRARPLYDVIVHMLRETSCYPVVDVVSDFFEWNPPGDAPGYVAGTNYVTGNANEVDLLYILQKSDAIGLVPPSDPATVAKLKLEDLLLYLAQMFNVFWDLDEDGNLRLEHWMYWTYPTGLNVPAASKAVELLTFSGNDVAVPRKEEFKLPEDPPRSGADYHEDFIGEPIEYSGPCVRSEEVKTTSLPISTCIAYLASADYEGGKDGFVLLACAPNPPSPNLVIRTTGALSAGAYGNVPNVPLSWANLHRDFFTWNRYLPSGRMNREEVTFDGFRPNTVQPNVRVIGLCCSVLDFDPSLRVITALATHLGVEAAHVKKATYTDQSEMLQLTLEYSVP